MEELKAEAPLPPGPPPPGRSSISSRIAGVGSPRFAVVHVSYKGGSGTQTFADATWIHNRTEGWLEVRSETKSALYAPGEWRSVRGFAKSDIPLEWEEE